MSYRLNWSFLTYHDDMKFNTGSSREVYQKFQENTPRIESQLRHRNKVIARLINCRTYTPEWRVLSVKDIGKPLCGVWKRTGTVNYEVQFYCTEVQDILNYLDGNQNVLLYDEIDSLERVLKYITRRQRLI